jgi:hypothetical protein
MYGDDQARALGVGLDALAQLGDLLVERPAVRHLVEAPQAVEEGVAPDDLRGQRFGASCATKATTAPTSRARRPLTPARTRRRAR